MKMSEFDDVEAHLLEPQESLDSEETGIDLVEGYSLPESLRELRAWGLTAREARTHESLARQSTPQIQVPITLPTTSALTAALRRPRKPAIHILVEEDTIASQGWRLL